MADLAPEPPASAFDLLGFAPCAWIDPETVRAAFQERAAATHPDAAATEAEKAARNNLFAALNEAQATLISTPRRLKHLVTLLTGTTVKSGQLGEEIMALFGKIGPALQAAEAFIRRRDATHSALAKALLAGEAMDLEASLTGLAAQIQAMRETLEESLKAIEPRNLQNAKEKLARAAQEASFLEKWDAQVQDARLRLMSQ